MNIFLTNLLQIESVYNKSVVTNYSSLVNMLPFKIVKFVALKSYNLIYMGWCLTPFIFLSYERWIEVCKAVNFFGLVYVVVWFVIYRIIKAANAKPKELRVASNATDLSPLVSQQRTSDSKATDLSPTLEENKKDN